jgi:hypothetical protein
MTDPDVQYLRSLASGYANSFINGWQTEYRHLNAVADRLESFMQAPSGQQAEPTDLKALAIQCGGLALRDDKCIAMDIDDLAKFAAALAGQQSERPAEAPHA